MIAGIFQDRNYQAVQMLLDATTARHSALAGNIANVETPGYQRQDLSPAFAAQLDAALTGKSATKTLEPAIAPVAHAPAQRADGNTVALDQELLELSKNAAEYEVLTQMMANSFRQLKAAITGRTA